MAEVRAYYEATGDDALTCEAICQKFKITTATLTGLRRDGQWRPRRAPRTAKSTPDRVGRGPDSTTKSKPTDKSASVASGARTLEERLELLGRLQHEVAKRLDDPDSDADARTLVTLTRALGALNDAEAKALALRATLTCSMSGDETDADATRLREALAQRIRAIVGAGSDRSADRGADDPSDEGPAE